jgi:hypothetical protein
MHRLSYLLTKLMLCAQNETRYGVCSYFSHYTKDVAGIRHVSPIMLNETHRCSLWSCLSGAFVKFI